MLLCTCGCRDARHEEIGKGVRGPCLRCSCGGFEDAKSVIEAELRPPPADLAPAAVSVSDTDVVWASVEPPSSPPMMPAPRIEAPEVARARERLAKLAPEQHAQVTADMHSVVDARRWLTGTPITSDMLNKLPSVALATYDAWWCEPCGSRAFNERRCCGNKVMEPIRVEIHARESP